MENFLRLKNQVDEIVDNFKAAEPDRKDKILNQLLTTVSIVPTELFQFHDLLFRFNMQNEYITQFKNILELKIHEIFKNKEFDQFFNVLRLIYICEYTNLFQSNIEELIDEFSEQTQNILIQCKNIEKNKLKLIKNENAQKICFKIAINAELKEEIESHVLNLISKVEKSLIKNVSIGDVNIALSTIESSNSERKECLFQILNHFDKTNFPELLSAILIFKDSSEENLIFSKFLITSLGRAEGFLAILYPYIENNQNSFFNSVLPMIYQNYYSFTEQNVQISDTIYYTPQSNEDEIEMFKSLITRDVAVQMIAICNLCLLKSFLPREFHSLFPTEINTTESILKKVAETKDFSLIDIMEKEKFFREFCQVSSPSVSHFLTYLEIFSSYFDLSEDEQKVFFSVFFEMNKNRQIYLSVICEKLLEFQVIDEDVAVQYDIFK